MVGSQTKRSTGRHVRAKIRHAAFTRAPLWITRGRVRRAKSVRRFRTITRTVVLPDLPDGLDGLRVAHLSDLHTGQMHRPQDLAPVIDATNQLQPHLIAVTGDYVDLSLNVLDHVIAELSRLAAPLGVYLVLGNHDYLENGDELIRRIRASRLRLLINQALAVPHRDCEVLVAGIDFAHRDRDLARLVHRTLQAAPPRNGHDLRLLLAHHPDAFDPACRHHVDLTLSGHTHGGQVMLLPRRGKKGSIGLGSLAFRYPHGLYRRGHSYLHVTAGLGSWFPLRLKCPAEIACLTLRNEPDPTDGQSHP